MGVAVARHQPINPRSIDYAWPPSSSRLTTENEQPSIPSAFVCAITQDVMTDPVTVSSGHSYERKAIVEWFSLGKRNDPATGLPLSNTNVIPNIRLRMAIEEWKEEQISKDKNSSPAISAPNAGAWIVISSTTLPVRCGPSVKSGKVDNRRPGEIVMAENLLDFDGGWLKVMGSESQYVRVSDGKRQNLAKLPDLDETKCGVWIVTSSAAQAVRSGPTDSSYKLGTRKKGELLFAEGSLTVSGVWLKLAAGQYILASNDSGPALERLPPLDRSQAGKWVVTCPPPSLGGCWLTTRAGGGRQSWPGSRRRRRRWRRP